MGRKAKPLPFRKGMQVVYLSRYGNISLTEAEVTVVTTKDGEPLIHTRHIDQWGNSNHRSFSPVAGMFQENPYPIWQVRPLDGSNMKNLKKRAEKASKLFREYEDSYRDMQRDVHTLASNWEHEEISRRGALIPHGPPFLQRVVARMGFKQPDQVRVRINGQTTTVSRN